LLRNNFNKSQKNFIKKRQKGLCGNCGDRLSDEFDSDCHHILRCEDGGVGIVENGVILCKDCHFHCHDSDWTKPVSIFRAEFPYANWKDNIHYKGRKKGEKVEFTKKTLNEFDKIGEKITMEYGSVDSYERHLNMLIGFRKELTILKKEIKRTAKQYKIQINAMAKAGFLKNHIDVQRARYNLFKVKIKELDDLIAIQTRKITKHEELIEGIINKLKWREY